LVTLTHARHADGGDHDGAESRLFRRRSEGLHADLAAPEKNEKARGHHDQHCGTLEYETKTGTTAHVDCRWHADYVKNMITGARR